jgi:hypothetical protein
MKKIVAILFTISLFSLTVTAQVRNLFVEKYYVSDTLDNSDTIDGQAHALPAGSVTYRIFVQLDSGCRIVKIYGTPANPFIIKSSSNFFNNIDRPGAYFGYMINKAWFTSNPTLALDSWLTLGLCAKGGGSIQYGAVLKNDDTNGSLIGGIHNTGGTAAIPGGLLVNNDMSSGAPITTSDGMILNTDLYTGWVSDGFINTPGSTDTSIFGSVNTGSQFYSSNAYLKQNNGAAGDSVSGNKVLVAQLTTTGDLAFQFNLEVIDKNGHTYNVVPDNHGTILTNDTIASGLLKYPPVCGCKDPNFLEYSPNYSCSNSDSCHTRIVFGCKDTLACNYDPNANYHIQYLCCYPGFCADRDISLVCPTIAGDGGLLIYPNPADEQITLQFSSGDGNNSQYKIYDSFGIVITEKDYGTRSGSLTDQVDISNLHTGLYLMRVFIGNSIVSKTFLKK